ncbi:MAG: hypothetical protein WCQ66_08490, partial [Sphaerochaetaceae bacterium]
HWKPSDSFGPSAEYPTPVMTCQFPLPMPTLAVASGLKLYSGEPADTPRENRNRSFPFSYSFL